MEFVTWAQQLGCGSASMQHHGRHMLRPLRFFTCRANCTCVVVHSNQHLLAPPQWRLALREYCTAPRFCVWVRGSPLRILLCSCLVCCRVSSTVC
jgi:hypothetical protein